jgi:acetolactate synthase-1/2/3 large subunit
MRSGAEAVIGTLAGAGVEVCFANPGTSEMHLVVALDREPRMRSILCLFEGVASGAADGYARMADRPAMTLLHLGSGLSNAGANIHNARRARTPMVNVIGDHATDHLQYDAPLTSDVLGLARPNHVWAASVPSAAHAGAFAAEAYRAACAGGPAALILPADCAWNTPASVAPPPQPEAPLALDPAAIEAAAQAIKAARKPVLLVNGRALRADGLAALARIEAAGVRVMSDTFFARQSRGAGRFAPARMQYFAEMALADLEGVDLLVLLGTRKPAAFFAYPGKPSLLAPPGATVLSAATELSDSAVAASALAQALGAPREGVPAAPFAAPEPPTGPLSPQSVGATLARHLPEGAVIVDDGVTSGLAAFLPTAAARPHEWLMLSGGAIGWGPPAAVGAAVGAPGAKVVCLAGDGAAMYPPQAFWTMAREGLDVLTIVFANRSYRILNVELMRTNAGNPGPAALSMLALDQPTIDFVGLAKAQGLAAVRCETAEDFEVQFPRLLAQPGPKLIEAII